MDALLEFARGPLFRLSFMILLLGLVRVLFLSVSDLRRMLRKAGEKNVPWADLVRTTGSWIVPVKQITGRRPVYSIVSVLFHIGVILVPLFYSAHVILWEKSTGFSWGFWLPQNLAHLLTLIVLAGGITLLLSRNLNRASRISSRRSDYFIVELLLLPFLTGIMMSSVTLAPELYDGMMLVHLFSGCLILILIPFTKIAHAALFPLGRFVAAAAWKFPRGAGEQVMATLGREKMREETPV